MPVPLAGRILKLLLAFPCWRFCAGISALAFLGWYLRAGISVLAYLGWCFEAGIVKARPFY